MSIMIAKTTSERLYKRQTGNRLQLTGNR